MLSPSQVSELCARALGWQIKQVMQDSVIVAEGENEKVCQPHKHPDQCVMLIEKFGIETHRPDPTHAPDLWEAHINGVGEWGAYGCGTFMEAVAEAAAQMQAIKEGAYGKPE